MTLKKWKRYQNSPVSESERQGLVHDWDVTMFVVLTLRSGCKGGNSRVRSGLFFVFMPGRKKIKEKKSGRIGSFLWLIENDTIWHPTLSIQLICSSNRPSRVRIIGRVLWHLQVVLTACNMRAMSGVGDSNTSLCNYWIVPRPCIGNQEIFIKN